DRAHRSSALDVRELFGHLAVAHPKNVDASHMAVLEAVPPPLDDSVARFKDFFFFEARPRVLENGLPHGSNLVDTHTVSTVRRRPSGIKNAVVRHESERSFKV